MVVAACVPVAPSACGLDAEEPSSICFVGIGKVAYVLVAPPLMIAASVSICIVAHKPLTFKRICEWLVQVFLRARVGVTVILHPTTLVDGGRSTIHVVAKNFVGIVPVQVARWAFLCAAPTVFLTACSIILR